MFLTKSGRARSTFRNGVPVEAVLSMIFGLYFKIRGHLGSSQKAVKMTGDWVFVYYSVYERSSGAASDGGGSGDGDRLSAGFFGKRPRPLRRAADPGCRDVH